eukprot:scaffold655_cov105-Isochrysis_galbana.AAC.15
MNRSIRKRQQADAKKKRRDLARTVAPFVEAIAAGAPARPRAVKGWPRANNQGLIARGRAHNGQGRANKGVGNGSWRRVAPSILLKLKRTGDVRSSALRPRRRSAAAYPPPLRHHVPAAVRRHVVLAPLLNGEDAVEVDLSQLAVKTAATHVRPKTRLAHLPQEAVDLLQLELTRHPLPQQHGIQL